jgi:hypothetical protein
MGRKVVLIDDTFEKHNAMRHFFQREFPEDELTWFKNFRQSQNNFTYFDYDLLLLDMSFEGHGATSEDVTFNGLAGLHVLKFLWVESIVLPTIILTTHDNFSVPDFGVIEEIDALKIHIQKIFGDDVLDCLSMGADNYVWESALLEIIKKAKI